MVCAIQFWGLEHQMKCAVQVITDIPNSQVKFVASNVCPVYVSRNMFVIDILDSQCPLIDITLQHCVSTEDRSPIFLRHNLMCRYVYPLGHP